MATVKITTLERCDRNGIAVDNGSYGRIVFDWTASGSTTATLNWVSSDGVSNSTAISLSGTSGTTATVFGEDELSIEVSYIVSITVSGVTASEKLSYFHFPVDILSGEIGTGVSIGKPAEKKGVLEVALDNEFLGTTMQKGNRFAYSTTGVSGTAGYIRMVSIELVNVNGNWPVTFIFNRRRTPTPAMVHITFDTVTESDSTLDSFVYEGSDMAVYVIQSQPLVWDIYVQKANENDTITLQDWYTSTNMAKRMKVSFPGDMLSTIPTSATRAVPAKIRSILDFVYPVGSIYISYNHTNPGNVFGGTWARIENAFLWGTDSSGTIGQTGGEKTHKLTTAELPSHSHGAVYSGNATGTKNLPWLSTGVIGTGDKIAYSAISTGDGAAHNNMPPYVQVSIWRRTA